MKKRIFRICAAVVICSAGFVPPGQSVASETLVGPIIAERSGADMKINGMIQKVPAGTKIWVDIVHVIRQPGGGFKRAGGPAGPQDANVIVAADGTFHANLRNISWNGNRFVDNGTFRPGSYAIMISAHFNRAWQTVDVLRMAGVELDSQGRSAVSTGRHLEAIREVKLGPIPADQAAVDAVKSATLDVKGSGRSSMPIGQSVDWYKSMGGMEPLAWSAARGPDAKAKWIVNLDYLDGVGVDRTQRKAQWSYDSVSKTVLYLDPSAKILSYVPAE